MKLGDLHTLRLSTKTLRMAEQNPAELVALDEKMKPYCYGFHHETWQTRAVERLLKAQIRFFSVPDLVPDLLKRIAPDVTCLYCGGVMKPMEQTKGGYYCRVCRASVVLTVELEVRPPHQ